LFFDFLCAFHPPSSAPACNVFSNHFACSLNTTEFDQVQFLNGRYFSERLKNFIKESKGSLIDAGHHEWRAVAGANNFELS